jgi:hypothetical protein
VQTKAESKMMQGADGLMSGMPWGMGLIGLLVIVLLVLGLLRLLSICSGLSRSSAFTCV